MTHATREYYEKRIAELEAALDAAAAHVAIVSPVTDSLGSFKPLGWHIPGEASVHIHADGTVSYEGTVHWFDASRGEDTK